MDGVWSLTGSLAGATDAPLVLPHSLRGMSILSRIFIRLKSTQAATTIGKEVLPCPAHHSDGTAAPVSVGTEDLHRYTSGRWLYNESTQLARRYVTFNAHALGKIAAEAIGAQTCTSIKKVEEGSFNKILLLSFENKAEVIARIPCPVTGPPHLVTASEVATMEFVRTVLNISVPKVFAWSSHADQTEVGAEFIILNKVSGVELAQVWDGMGAHVKNVAKQLSAIEQKFASVRFPHYGSIFFREDVQGYPHASRLYADDTEENEISGKYTIGPHMEWDLWRGERAYMDVDRGPWKCPESYISGLVKCEQEWLKRFAKQRDPADPFSRSPENNSPAAHIAFLDKFLSVVPCIIPSSHLLHPTLWHTDLHRSNIFMAPSPPHDLVSIIDWQGMGVGPFYAQAVFPKAMLYTGKRITIDPLSAAPPLPANYDELSPEEQKATRIERVQATVQNFYQVLIRRNPLHMVALSHRHLHTILDPVYSATRTWHEGLHTLRYMLARIQLSWDDLVPSGTPCPLQLTQAELELYVTEYDRNAAYEARVNAVQHVLDVQGDGWVSNERFDEVKARSEEIKATWDYDAAGGAYPYQEGASSLMV